MLSHNWWLSRFPKCNLVQFGLEHENQIYFKCSHIIEKNNKNILESIKNIEYCKNYELMKAQTPIELVKDIIIDLDEKSN